MRHGAGERWGRGAARGGNAEMLSKDGGRARGMCTARKRKEAAWQVLDRRGCMTLAPAAT